MSLLQTSHLKFVSADCVISAVVSCEMNVIRTDMMPFSGEMIAHD